LARTARPSGIGYTLQLNNPALLAELTGIDVISDFRARDVAAGGQGAPLVPAFHAAVFGAGAVHGPRAILNVGGIANLTLLPPAAEDDVNAGIEVLGFDCGPGNALMDGWCREHLGTDYDDGGRWAASGHVHAGLLTQCLAEPFFRQPPPKSTGRDLFNRGWLDAQLATIGATGARALAPVDVQTTLLALTARSAIEALRRAAPATSELLVCGGGAFNLALLQALAAAWPGLDVTTTGRAGLPPMLVESAAFAWLARAFTTREPGNRPTVTGARGARILGALYPA
jgi:anhydro-N-acetylmuramic acid kinase